MDVTILRNFREDRRTSMDVYADALIDALRTASPIECQVREFRPTLALVGQGPWGMRIARYVSYPLQARRASQGISHVVDQGYAHLLHALDPERTVVTVHDVIPLVRWRGGISGVPSGSRPWLNSWSASALRRAAHLIAISQHTRTDLIRYCGCDPDRISVVYYGIERGFRVLSPRDRAEARQRWNLPDDGTRRVLMVGSAFYKNQQTALQAFATLRASTDVPLELVGIAASGGLWRSEVQRLKLGDVVREIDHVEHEDMPEIYNCVDVLLFPSFYEGFGRPPVEAMACGTPAVVSNASALPEAVGDAALMCDPLDHRTMAAHLQSALCDRVQRVGLIKQGLAWSRRFTWQENARQTAVVYRRVSGSREGGD